MNEKEVWKKMKNLKAKENLAVAIVLVSVLGLIAGILMAAFSIIVSKGTAVVIIVISFVVIIIAGIISGKYKNAVNALINDFLGPFIEEKYSNYIGYHSKISDEGRINNFIKETKESNLFSNYNEYDSSEYLEVDYDGLRLSVARVRMENETTSGTGEDATTDTETIFDGMWIIVDSNRRIDTPFYIRNNRKNKKKENKASNLSNKVITSEYKLSLDEINNVLDKIKDITEGLVSIAFIENKIHIAIDTAHCFCEFDQLNKKGVKDMESLKAAIETEIKYELSVYEQIKKIVAC